MLTSRLSHLLAGAKPAVLRDASGTFVLRSTYVGLEFLCALVLARFFGATDYGVYAVVMAWVGLLAIPAALGFDRLLVREVAASRAVGAWGAARGVMRRSTQLVLAASVLLALVGALAITPFAPVGTQDALRLGMLIVPLLAYARVRQSILQGLGRVVIGQIPEMLILPLTLLALVAVAAITGLSRSGGLAVGLQLAATAAACLFGVIVLRACLPTELRAATPEYRSLHWMRSANWLVLMMAMNVVLTTSDTVILAWMRDAREAGIYRVASQMATFVVFPLTALNMAMAPRIAAMHASQDREGLRREASMVMKLAVLLAVPIACILIGAGAYLLRLFGSAFVEGYAALVILSLAYVVNAFAGSAGYLLIMTQHEGTAAKVFSFAAALAVGANLVLTPAWGSVGAAAGTALGVVSLSFGLLWQARRHLLKGS